MSGDVVALAPGPAGALVTELTAAAGDLEDAAEQARRRLLAVDRSSGAPALIEDVAGWSRRLAGELDDRIDAVVRLDAAASTWAAPTSGMSGSPAHVGAPSSHTAPSPAARYLDVRGIGDIDDLLRALAEVGVLPACPVPGDVAARRAATRLLGTTLLERLADQAPQAIGNADGAPFAVRDRANRRRLARHVDRLESRGGTLTASERRLLTDLRAWRADRGLQIVKLDVARGRVVLARGELDSATHVAAIVPGAGLTLDGISRRHLGWMDGLRATMADRLRGTDAAPATVLWLDYDTPGRLVPDAMGRAAATDAAQRLPGFLEAVAAGRPRLVTVVGHSYGSVVLGRSLAEHPGRLAADQLVALGSPGLGVQLASTLGLRDDQRLLAATFDDDPIAHVGTVNALTGDLGRLVHGPDPRRLRGVEHVALSAHDLRDADPVERHLQYLDADSSALWIVADLAAGTGSPPSG